MGRLIQIRQFFARKPRLPRWCLGAFVLLALCAFFGQGFLYTQLVDKPFKKAIASTLEESSREYVALLNAQLEQLAASLEKVSADAGAIAALALPEDNATALSEKARVLEVRSPRRQWLYDAKAKIGIARQLYLVNGEVSTFPLPGNFVAESLYNQALAGNKPQPRATKLEGWQIYLARPVIAGGNVAGVLLVQVEPKVLQKAIADARPQGGIRLIQSVKGQPPGTVFSIGTGWKEEHSLSLQTQVPEWQLQFVGSEALLEKIQPSLWGYRLVVCLLWSAALASAIWIGLKNLTFAVAPVRKARAINPMDDLFTEKFERREKTSAATDPYQSKLPPAMAGKHPAAVLPGHVFRDYDIRGRADREISEEFARLLGKTLGSRQVRNGEAQLVVAADGRLSSPALKKALIAGIAATGCQVVDIGAVPTPVMNFVLATGDCDCGVMVTASHNPREDNGFKLVIANHVLNSDEIQALRAEMMAGNFTQGEGAVHSHNPCEAYMASIAQTIPSATGFKIVIDAGNGITGALAPALFRRLGCHVTELFTAVDGSFPNHDPDPTVPENLQPLIATVASAKADLGLAFDGDGDRVVVVSGSGRIVWPDELLMIFARDLIVRQPGADVVFDVKSTRRLRELVESYGGKPIMWKTGHAHIRNKVRETRAPVGGEFSGHIFFNDRWFGFDDGLYAAARLLEIIAIREQNLDAIMAGFPECYCTPEIKIPVSEDDKHQIIKEILLESSQLTDARVIAIDGLRLEYAEGWGLVRASNTSAALTLRFEADTQAALDAIIERFKTLLRAAAPDLALDF